MGLVGTAYGLACAVTLAVAALSRVRATTLAAAVLAAMWGLTKAVHFPSDSEMGIYVDAFDFLLGGMAGILLVADNPNQYWRRIFVSVMLAELFLIVIFASSLETGLTIPKPAYEAVSNVLYAIALLCVFTRGLRDGALSFRTGVPGDRHDGSWASPGARWGRTAEKPPRFRR